MTWLRNSAIVATLVLTLSGGALAITSSSGNGRVIYGCYQKKKGTLRVVGARAKCKKSETAIAWNQTGPQGNQGLQGPKGDKGDAGPATGAAGGDLTGNYPNPTIASGKVTGAALAAGAAASNLGTAGGDLTGTWPNLTVGTGKVTSSKLADHSVTSAKLGPNAIAPYTFEVQRDASTYAGSPPAECCAETGQFFFKSGSTSGATSAVLDLTLFDLTSVSFQSHAVLLKAGCNGSHQPIATVENDSGLGATLQGSVAGNAAASTYFLNSGLASPPQDILRTNTHGEGHFTVAFTDDMVVSVQYLFDNAQTFGSENVCTVAGTATYTAS